jgi:arginine decarboxylase
VQEIRHKNSNIPIYIYGETRTSRHIPNDILKELHGFIHMFEDTPEFVARHIIREAKAYLDSLAPPFFRALVNYAYDGSYSWHCPGHSGGVAFLKSPIGQMFHQFFGENMLRADVCNAVEELGQLLDHTGPVAKSERNAARIYGADHCYFVTNGTSTSNKMVWHSTVAPGDIVVVDRNCHKSILHSIIMCGAIPVFLMPTRNNLGIIGPIPLEEFTEESIARKIEANPFAREAKDKKPRILTITQSTYDGVVYNVETLREMLDGKIETLHFDEAWLPHATFHDFYKNMHAIGRDRPRAKQSMIFSTQSTHKLLAGLSQASQVLVRESESVKLDQDAFNEAFLMHTSTSPQYSIIASCDVAAAMMEAPGGTALVEESILEALDFRRAMKKVDEEFGKDWWFKVWGPDNVGRRHRHPGRLDDPRRGRLARLRQPGAGLQHARPDQGDRRHPGPVAGRQVRRDRHPGLDRDQVPGRTRRDHREVRAVLVLHHVHDRDHQGPLEHAGDGAAAVQGRLRPQQADVAGDAAVRRGQPALRKHAACATCARRSTPSTSSTTWRA